GAAAAARLSDAELHEAAVGCLDAGGGVEAERRPAALRRAAPRYRAYLTEDADRAAARTRGTRGRRAPRHPLLSALGGILAVGARPRAAAGHQRHREGGHAPDGGASACGPQGRLMR